MIVLGIYGAFDWDANSSNTADPGYDTWAHESGASIFVGGEHICSITEERLTRIKYDGNYPENAINYCLETADVFAEDVTHIAFPLTPYTKWQEKISNGELISFYKEHFPNAEVIVVSHHVCHIMSSVMTSPFDSGSFITFDGGGSLLLDYEGKMIDYENNSIGYFDKNKKSLRVFNNRSDVNGFGHLYSKLSFQIYSKYLNKQINPYDSEHRESVVGKIMGLSAYGNTADKFRYYIPQDNGYCSTPYLIFDNSDVVMYNDSIEYSAAKLQNTLEEGFSDLMVALDRNQYLEENICFSGGIFMNVLNNTLIKRKYQNIHIPPYPNDVGLCLGAALYVLFKFGIKPEFGNNLSLLGRNYSEQQIKDMLEQNNLNAIRYEEDDLCEIVANELHNGKIIAWFQGRSEFGSRALGSRSILMNATKKENKDILNSRVKHREYWRPFAGIILEENLDEYFEDSFSSPYMMYSMIVRENKRSVIPAITHEDFSCRIQSVNEQYNARVTKLLHKYKQLSGIPVILNTSFNDNGEPIVETPADAIRAFLNMDIDTLAIGNYIVKKENT